MGQSLGARRKSIDRHITQMILNLYFCSSRSYNYPRVGDVDIRHVICTF